MARQRAGKSTWPDDAGLTLVEVLVSLVIINLISVFVIKISMTSAMWTRDALQRGMAADYAYAVMEIVRHEPTLLQTGPLEGEDVRMFLNPSQTGAETPYTWAVEATPWQDSSALSRVRVDISWQQGDKEQHVELWSLVYVQNPTSMLAGQ